MAAIQQILSSLKATAASGGITVVGIAGTPASGGDGVATVSLPAGTTTGDLVIAYAMHPARTSSANPIMNTSGYTAVDGGDVAVSTIGGRAWWKVMAATPDTTVAIKHPASIDVLTVGVIVLRGAHATPIGNFATQTAGYGFLTAPAISPTHAGSVLVSIGGALREASSSGNPTGLTGYTSSVVGSFSASDSGTAFVGATGVAYKVWGGGAEPATQWTYSDTPLNRWAHGYIIAVRPA